MLRRQLVRWLLVIDDPPSLRVVRDDGTLLRESRMESDAEQPVYEALLAVSGGARGAPGSVG